MSPQKKTIGRKAKSLSAAERWKSAGREPEAKTAKRKKTSVDLRPLSIGEMLDRAFRLYKMTFFKAIVIAAVGSVPLVVMQTFLGTITTLPQNTILLLLALAALFFIATAISWGAYIHLFAQEYLGIKATLSEAFVVGVNQFFPLLAVTFLTILVLSIPAIILVVIIGEAFIFLAIPFALYLSTYWILSYPIIVIENKDVLESMRRSWNFVHKAFWRVLGIVFVTLLFTSLVGGLPSITLALGEQLIPDAPVDLTVLGAVIGSIAGLVVAPLSMAVYVVLYYDLRVRMEGFDLELMTQLQK